MARLPRSVLPSYGIFHVTSRGVNKCMIYLDDDDRRSFTDLFRTTSERQRLKIWAYVLMGNHYHAVVEAYLESLSAAFHRINGTHAQRFNKRHERTGHLFQDRFHAKLIRDDEHLGAACEYVWNNPVRIGLCDEAHDWPWGGCL